MGLGHLQLQLDQYLAHFQNGQNRPGKLGPALAHKSQPEEDELPNRHRFLSTIGHTCIELDTPLLFVRSFHHLCQYRDPLKARDIRSRPPTQPSYINPSTSAFQTRSRPEIHLPSCEQATYICRILNIHNPCWQTVENLD